MRDPILAAIAILAIVCLAHFLGRWIAPDIKDDRDV